MLLLCSIPGDIGLFSKMTIEIGWNRSVLEEEVRIRTKFENRRVLVPLVTRGYYAKTEAIN